MEAIDETQYICGTEPAVSRVTASTKGEEK